MKILMVGGGGREHALLWALKTTSRVNMELFCAPGNAGISEIAECFPVRADDLAGLLALAQKIKPDLTVVGPEAPLVAGIVNLFSANGFSIVGPTAKAAMLEGSKKFAKEFMWRHKIPTPDARFFDNPNDASAFIKRQLLEPPVVKADGLAAGKGVVVAKNMKEALAAVDDIMLKKKFGDAGKWVLVERKHAGQECSLIVLTDGSNVIPFLPATDFKRRHDNNDGKNTGGMGCYSPVPALTNELLNQVMGKIVIPTIRGMAEEGNPYHGFLYFGLMLTEEGPLVLEYNARMGDPEAAVILPLLDSDLSDLSELLLSSTLPDGLRGMKIKWKRGAAVGVVAVHEDYPDKSSSGEIITGTDLAEKTGALVFHAGTAKNAGGELVTAGGRILDVVGIGENFAEAHEAAYIGAGLIRFKNMDYRMDIASEVSKV